MNDRIDQHVAADPDATTSADGNTITPLPGEPGIPDVAAPPRSVMSRKGLLAVGLLVTSLVAVSAISIHRYTASSRKSEDTPSKRAGDRPSAATVEPRKLELPSQPPSAVAAASPRIPALEPTADEAADPIGVRRTGQGSPGATGTTSTSAGVRVVSPQDAPVLLVSTRPGAMTTSRRPDSTAAAMDAGQDDPTRSADPQRNLRDYQRQLQGLLDNLTRTTTLAVGQATGQGNGAVPLSLPTTASVAAPVAAGNLFGGQLQGSATPRVAATLLGNRSLTLPKGTAFTCALKTKVISAASGMVGCQVQRNVYSDDGRVLLIERGSHMDGEYRIGAVRPGTVRIPVLWTRIRTPNGVTVDIDSPGTGPLGESGIDGYVDNRWGERIGAAMLLSLIDDSVKLVIQNETNSSNTGTANTVVLPSTTANASKLAEKVLDSTINIPPLIYQNQGGIVGIYVARDVDFSSVYELQPVER